MIADLAQITAIARQTVGEPTHLEILKERAKRRRTLRAVGPRGRVIVKSYASDRASIVAERILALADGPAEPVIPRVLDQDPGSRTIVLSEVPGLSLGRAISHGDSEPACWRTGIALARWHQSWEDRVPVVFQPHSPDRELAILQSWANQRSDEVAHVIMEAAKSLAVEWTYRTVIHRDLYEEQVMLDALVGLIDLDDAAAGPPELDLGNLLAHLDFRYPADGWRTPQKLEAALLEGYEAGGGSLNPYLLNRCRRLTLLRLACIHGVDALVERAAENVERLNS